ncbi:UPF0262 family protein [Parvularcula dongshanensis]|uniref:Uncharacterized protein (UPF0262 family) n=1 Tax=Parvularcula dongshanensis TaxID=1173995 RepID=A0A840I432_9PROT|nr:UPF0262 family protein [Parvularcula dongshanensis]MBB4659023.1 uncharacterized protein (UPF0262 family) [Parvularcula dongshanensis]
MPTRRLTGIELDQASLSAPSTEIDHERQIAVRDLLAENSFAPVGIAHQGPYVLHLSGRDGRLVFEVRDEAGEGLAAHHLSLGPLRRTIKDYFLLFESYFDTLRSATPEKLETVDMARRAVHDEGATLLRDRLAGKIELDPVTSRRMFTLVCAVINRAGPRR